MVMHRFFFDPQAHQNNIVTLSKDESHHLSRVLRLDVGTQVELLDGLGAIYSGVVKEVGKQVQVEIRNVLDHDDGLGKEIRLFQGVLKGDKMDSVIQRCTELGITRISPFWSSRCQGKLTKVQQQKKYDRWSRVIVSACKQCKRSKKPTLDSICMIDNVCLSNEQIDPSLCLFFWESENKKSLSDIEALNSYKSISLVLGPEGGFSSEEAALMTDMCCTTVGLGPRILRAETASLAAVAVVQYLLGGLK